jgi:hypothetical protein
MDGKPPADDEPLDVIRLQARLLDELHAEVERLVRTGNESCASRGRLAHEGGGTAARLCANVASDPDKEVHVIDEVLKQVSENCLRGQPVPAVLKVLWEAQLAGRSPISGLEFGEVELVSEYDDEFFEGYDAEFCGSAAVARAYERMFRQIAFIGRTDEGDLLGYWLRGEDGSIEDAPIVVLDSEGQFHCTAVTLQDHFVQAAGDDPVSVASIRRWFARKGIETGRSPEAVWEAVAGLPDPNELSWRYQEEETAEGS